jgi:hypothetical protein
MKKLVLAIALIVAVPVFGTDQRISQLPAATSALLPDEFVVNEAGVSKKLTLTQISTLLKAQPLPVGVGAATYLPSGAILSSTTQIGNTADTNEDILWTDTLLGNSLAVNGQRIRITAEGSFANNGDTKTIRFYFGSTVVLTVSNANALISWRGVVEIARTGPTSQISGGGFTVGGSANTTTSAPAEILANAITLKVTAQDSSPNANTIVVKHVFVEFLPEAATTTRQTVVTLGDSKTWRNEWQMPLSSTLSIASGTAWYVANGGVNGATVATTASTVSTILAGVNPPDNVTDVLIDLGVNEMGSLPAEATWETNYLTVIDAVHAKWPAAHVRIMRPWKRGFDTDSDTLANYINVIQAARSSFVILGPDERVWLKSSDNGTANTTDGTHYSTAGNTAVVAQWKTQLGY